MSELHCAGCLKNTPNREYLICSQCNDRYDLECANVSTQRFYNTMSTDHKKSWICQSCKCKKPKTDNRNTPIRHQWLPEPQDHPDVNNVTIRKRTVHSTSSVDASILGDTMCLTASPNANVSTELTLHDLSQMIAERLKENNLSIITQIQTTIQIEINRAITKLKQDIKLDLDHLKKENSVRAIEIDKLTQKIETMKSENENLNKQITELGNTGINSYEGGNKEEGLKKSFVVYGVEDIYKEPERALESRLIRIFFDVLKVDLTGYVEETRRIGKYQNKNRPLIVELISKRMVKYLLENYHYFQGTGIAIAPMLTEKKRTERKLLREEMLAARREGLHAVIRENQLYIQGQRVRERVNFKNTTDSTTEETETENKLYRKPTYLLQMNKGSPQNKALRNYNKSYQDETPIPQSSSNTSAISHRDSFRNSLQAIRNSATDKDKSFRNRENDIPNNVSKPPKSF